MKKSLILISGLLGKFNKEVGFLLSDLLDMYYLDVNSLIEYELADKNNIIDKCGIEYFNNLESKVIEKAFSYENTIITLDYDMLANHGKNYLDRVISFYLAFSKQYIQNKNNKVNVVDRMAFPDRDKLLSKLCNYKLNLNKRNKNIAVNEIIKTLKEEIL